MTPTSAPGASPTPGTGTQPTQVLAGMTLPQRVGELLMVANPAGSVSTRTQAQIADYHVGSVILMGRSTIGVAQTREVVDALRDAAADAAPGGPGLLVAADQEGGSVQVLQGPGFDRIPSALYQGTHLSLQAIRSDAGRWGTQLRKAGIDLDLAPVMDTVPESSAAQNAPIGAYDREFAYTPHEVAMRGTAFANGLRDAGVGVTIKHFPGLGYVTGNTDTSSGVTDSVTTDDGASLEPFIVGIKAGADAVMVSTAIYSRIDPGVPAAFSTTIMRTMLRDQLGFTGVIVSDDLGNAQQVQAWTPETRAVTFIASGGDLVLTANPSTVGEMYRGLLAKAQSDKDFRAQVNAAALKVLQLKQRLGLLQPAR